MEFDMTGGTGTQSATTQRLYNEYSDIIDFMSIRGSQQSTFVDSETTKLTNVKLPKLPPELEGTFNQDDWFRVYINGVFISPAKYTYTYDYVTNEITFIMNTSSPTSPTSLGYTLESTDEIGVTGKFIEL